MKLKICGRNYTIKRADIGDNLGLCEPATGVISIHVDLKKRSSIPADLIEFHEIIHAVLYETGLSFLLPENVEEAVVSGLSTQLHNLGYTRKSILLPED